MRLATNCSELSEAGKADTSGLVLPKVVLRLASTNFAIRILSKIVTVRFTCNYSGQGEDAIGVAAMESNRQNVRTRGARHDAETRQGSDSNRNFRSSGTATTVRGSGTSDRRFYLRFDSPGGGTVQAAVLRLYLPNNESGDLEVFATTNFTEGNIRGNNRPSQGSRIDRIPLGQRGFYEFDVTNYVNDNRNRDINFVVRARGTNAVQILTSETGNSSRRPQLKWMQRR